MWHRAQDQWDGSDYAAQEAYARLAKLRLVLQHTCEALLASGQPMPPALAEWWAHEAPKSGHRKLESEQRVR